MTGVRKYLDELLVTLIDAADAAIPGEDGPEKEKWATEKLVSYAEAQDSQFIEAIIGFTGLKVDAEIVKKLVDNDFADGIQRQVLTMLAKTAIRLAYGQKWIRDRLTRKDELTEEEEADFQKAKDALLTEKPAAKTKTTK